MLAVCPGSVLIVASGAAEVLDCDFFFALLFFCLLLTCSITFAGISLLLVPGVAFRNFFDALLETNDFRVKVLAKIDRTSFGTVLPISALTFSLIVSSS